jgi:hypothetical protein
MFNKFATLLALSVLFALAACDDDDGKEADKLGVGAQCTATAECDEETQECLLDFKGGYCGVKECTGDVDCPGGSRCVAHDDGFNYCFLVCIDKAECNVNRDLDNESNCSSSIDFVDEPQDVKACIPPSN